MSRVSCKKDYVRLWLGDRIIPKGVFLATHPSSAAPWARWSAMRALAPDSQIASEGETSKFYQLMARLRMEEADAVTILEVRIPKNSYQYLYCDYLTS